MPDLFLSPSTQEYNLYGSFTPKFIIIGRKR